MPASRPAESLVARNLAWLDDELDALDAAHLARHRRERAGAQGATIELQGRRLVNFGSNDYLGLAAEPRLAAAMSAAAGQYGTGAGASALLVGYGTTHRELEARLARFERCEAALAFATGYAANVGTITAMVGTGDAVFSDRLNHASIIDGCRLSRAMLHVYDHADGDDLRRLLANAAPSRRRLIVTDSVFSMDGDFAPLASLAELADEFDAMLMVDEAHATGVLGDEGRGLAEQLGVAERVDIRVGTLSKALGCAGGFVAGPQGLIDWLVNRARPYVFSTAMPAAVAAAAIEALNIIEQQPQRRQQLARHSAWLRSSLVSQGWEIGPSQCQIIPIVVGAADRAIALSDKLLDAGFYVPAIRPPTVPAGQSRLRLSVTAAHTEPMLEALVAALANVRSS